MYGMDQKQRSRNLLVPTSSFSIFKQVNICPPSKLQANSVHVVLLFVRSEILYIRNSFSLNEVFSMLRFFKGNENGV